MLQVRNKKEFHKTDSYDELLEWLSPELRGHVLLHMCGRALRNVWYLNELSDSDCLVELAQRLQRAAFPAREKIAAQNTLKIILRGARRARGWRMADPDARSAASARPAALSTSRPLIVASWMLLPGIAAKGGLILYGFNFDMWGEDIILHAQVLRDKRSATALTYCELYTLDRGDLYDVLEEFPKAAAQVGESRELH